MVVICSFWTKSIFALLLSYMYCLCIILCIIILRLTFCSIIIEVLVRIIIDLIAKQTITSGVSRFQTFIYPVWSRRVSHLLHVRAYNSACQTVDVTRGPVHCNRWS